MILLFCAVTAIAGAEARPAPAMQTASDQDLVTQLRLLYVQLLAYPRWLGLVLVFAGALPVFFGWTLIRFFNAVSCATIAGAACLIGFEHQLTPVPLWIVAGVAALIGLVLGAWIYHILISLKGALLAALLAYGLSLTSMPPGLSPPMPLVIMVSAMLVAAVLGGLAGWKLASWVAIAETTLAGTALMAAGLVCLAKPIPDTQALMVAGFCALITIPAGLFVQARREAARGS